MFTSYFANMRNIKVPLSISRYQPSWYNGPRMTMLAPSADLLSAYKSGRVSIKDYTRIYTSETLSRYNPIEMYNWIVSKHSDSAALLCYEKPGEFCHRRLVAEWLEQASNVSIEELAAPVRQSPALAITQLGPWVKS